MKLVCKKCSAYAYLTYKGSRTMKSVEILYA